ncbi:MAG: hypothetical protein WCF08_10480 [Anaerolineaceae bacterium]
MSRPIEPSLNKLEQAVESFWESFPLIWRRVRGHIRGMAVSPFDITVDQFHMLRHIRKGLRSVSELTRELFAACRQSVRRSTCWWIGVWLYGRRTLVIAAISAWI